MKAFRTNTVTTSDWLKASENIKLSAYDPALGLPISTEHSEGHTFTQEDFASALERASQPITPLKADQEKE